MDWLGRLARMIPGTQPAERATYQRALTVRDATDLAQWCRRARRDSRRNPGRSKTLREIPTATRFTKKGEDSPVPALLVISILESGQSVARNLSVILLGRRGAEAHDQ